MTEQELFIILDESKLRYTKIGYDNNNDLEIQIKLIDQELEELIFETYIDLDNVTEVEIWRYLVEILRDLGDYGK